MPIDFGKYVYHFTTAETALLYILPNLQLKFSSPSKTNDPSENKGFGYYYIFRDLLFKEIEGRKLFRDYIENNIKLICFSKDYVIKDGPIEWDTNGYNHPTMWAHYAGKYSGVCLVFNKNELEKSVLEKNYVSDSVKYEYELWLPRISKESYDNEPLITIDNYIKENLKNLFFNKHLHWRVEHEFRILQIGTEQFMDVSNSIVGVYIGKNFDQTQIHCLKKTLPENCWIEKVDFYEGRFITLPVIL